MKNIFGSAVSAVKSFEKSKGLKRQWHEEGMGTSAARKSGGHR
jgi:hypothetical protein